MTVFASLSSSNVCFRSDVSHDTEQVDGFSFSRSVKKKTISIVKFNQIKMIIDNKRIMIDDVEIVL